MEWDHEKKMKGCFDLDLQEAHVVERVDHEMEWFDLDMEEYQWMEWKELLHEVEDLWMLIRKMEWN